ncbi:MAG: FAD-dependent oxidoreductase [Spirochaetia bacterium]
MSSINYTYSREIPVIKTADVVVFGGGPGGLGAAVTAARNGVSVVLVERYGCLGGMASFGEVHPFMPNHVDGKPLDGPVYTEWIKAMERYQPAGNNDRFIHKDAAALAAEDLILGAGGELLYHHTVTDTVVTDRKIDAAVLHSKSGFCAVRGKVYIDCTGDADLAALSGCEIEQGGPSGHSQPMTLCFKLRNIDIETARRETESANIGELRKYISREYEEAKDRGELRCPREDVLFFSWFDEDILHFNTTRIIHKNGVKGQELSEAEIEGRKQVREFLDFFRNRIPGFENCRIHSMAHHIGIRETRRVRGLKYLTRTAFEKALKVPDAIARCRYPIDIHNPDGTGTEFIGMKQDDWYEIPYGCTVSKDIDNLLIGGRPISVDHALHSSMRVMPPACSVGQGAGIGAALSVRKGCLPGDVDGREVHSLLKEQGAPL